MDERQHNELRDGAGDSFSTAFELVVTPAIFGLLGWLIDSRVGLFPVFTLALAGFVLAYQVWKLYTQYNLDMDAELEARRAAYGRSSSSREATS